MPRKSVGGPYPPDWKQIASAVKAEAGNRCIRCGHPNGDRAVRNPLPKGVQPGPCWNPVEYYFKPCDERCTHPRDYKTRVLTVHHLDMNPANCAWWNLAALCQVCHLQVQAKVIMERAYMFSHSEWFKPYVAGYYAHQHGEPETRPAVMAHLDRLLAYGTVTA